MVDDHRELLDDLVLEAKDHLESIEPDFLTLEQKSDDVPDDLINRLFRSMHSIKGGFSFMNLMNIANLAHSMETVLSRVRDGELKVSSEVMSALLDGVDKLTTLINDAENSDSESIQSQMDKLAPFKEEKGGEDAVKSELPETKPVSAEQEQSAEPETIIAEDTKKVEEKSIEQKPEKKAKSDAAAKGKTQSTGVEALRVRLDLLNKLMNLAGELVLARNQIVNKMNHKVLDIIGGDQVSKKIDTFMAHSRQSLVNAIKKSSGNAANGNLDELINADSKKIKKDFLSLLSEPLSEIPSVKSIVQQIGLVTGNIEESIMRTRMQPVGALFTKLQRIIRDLARNMGKNIELELSGEEVELDKSIIEALSDPLTHMIRNCGDHAIETPAERENAGKPQEGLIQVKAFHEGDQAVIEISDDGKGIDPNAVKEKALEKGIITPEEAETISDQEAQELIFSPGFSTAAKVTDVSGRGVGMDVVKTNTENIGGTVELISTVGEGTTIRLKLPLTMAIIPALLLETGGRTFALPQASIEDLVRIKASDVAKSVENLGGSAVIRRRGRLLPLIRLSEVLEQNRTFRNEETGETQDNKRELLIERRTKPMKSRLDKDAKSDDPEEGDAASKNKLKNRSTPERRKSVESAIQVCVLKMGAHRYGLIVDNMHENEEIVVKPLSGFFKGCLCYAGASILGDGKMAMILDPAGIAKQANMTFSATEQENEAGEQSALKQLVETQNVLLFKNGTKEHFALNIDLVARIVKIKPSELYKVGDKEFMKHAEQSLRVLRLHDFLSITKPESESEWIFVIIPKLVKHPMGLVASEVLNIVPNIGKLDTDSISGTGILGSSLIDGKLTLFVDIYNLFEAAEPDIYKFNLKKNSLKGKRILLAEDTAFFRHVIAKYMKECGCEIDAYPDGKAAWEKLNSGTKYDMLLTDINMPHMNGLELTRRVRSSASLKTMPIVACTSMTFDRDRQLGIEAGIDAYEIKVDKERLISTIIRIFEDKKDHSG